MSIVLNNPRLTDNIGRLKYIGPHFRAQFRKANIRTLNDLKNLVESQTRAQNTRFLRTVLENPRKLECVGAGRYDPESREYRKYCVRRVNQLAWYSVVTYLKSKGVSSRLLPPAVEDRGVREQCANKDKCSARGPAELLQRRYDRIPYYSYEHLVFVMLNTPNRTNFTGERIWRLMGRQVPLRNISSTLSKNSDGQGRDLFVRNGTDRDTGRSQYKLKPAVKRRLKNKTPQQILDYLRKL
jgi:hypothetical protein